jgi:putative hydrolases of HD superfamily
LAVGGEAQVLSAGSPAFCFACYTVPMKNRDLELLFELGAIRYIQRTWRHFLGPDFANLAEHSMRVAWTALMIAKNEGVTNTDKILKMALVHDIPESRTGDVNYLQRQYTKRDEELAIRDMFKDTSFGEEFVDLWNEYEARSSIEGKIVKDADNLDVDFEIIEQKSKGYKIEEWLKIREHTHNTKLYTDTAKQIWKGMQSADPHAWHLNARNRYNSGDWKPKT